MDGNEVKQKKQIKTLNKTFMIIIKHRERERELDVTKFTSRISAAHSTNPLSQCNV